MSDIDYAAEWQKKEEHRLKQPYERSDVQWTLAMARKVYAQDILFMFEGVVYAATPQTLLTVQAKFPLDYEGYPVDVPEDKLAELEAALKTRMAAATSAWLANKAKAALVASTNIANVLARLDAEALDEPVE
jgi:hypothetical protein